MKLILEDTNEQEITIIIKGNLADERIQNIVSILKSSTVSNKIIVYDEEKEILVAVNEIQYFTVENRKVYAIIDKKQHVVKYTLTDIALLFKNQGIVQIGKSLLVNIHQVKSLEAEFSGNYIITLLDSTQLVASRLYMKEFRKAIMEV